MAIVVVFAEPKPEPKAKPGVLAYTAPVVAAGYVPSAAYVESTYHGNFGYPYVSAPYVAAPYAYSAYAYLR